MNTTGVTYARVNHLTPNIGYSQCAVFTEVPKFGQNQCQEHAN